mmetsp:Transcript_28265/g.39966  ORF Transcript_28265/g.39966 Transcript_28265/m.39966 type:complete len:216 (+) Transcript_28265:117-764(+)
MASAQSVTTGDDEDNTTNYRVRSFSIAFPKDGENGVDDRRKKRNKKEKDRSNKICELISALRSTLEEGGVSVPRATKQVILQQAINHIRQLEDFKTRAHLLVSKSTKHAALTPSVPATSSSRPTVSMVGAGLERERALLDAVLRQKNEAHSRSCNQGDTDVSSLANAFHRTIDDGELCTTRTTAKIASTGYTLQKDTYCISFAQCFVFYVTTNKT